MLRDVFLIARLPLLAAMRGGEFAFLKMAPHLDTCACAMQSVAFFLQKKAPHPRIPNFYKSPIER